MATITPDTTNTLFQLAIDLVNQSSRNIFLTGKAGTGKTTFLKYVRENCPKLMAVVAPTGVAAINAGGVTIHSFFQLPLSPFIPEARGFSKEENEALNPHSLVRRLRFTKEKTKLLEQLELLVIDEISMVRCDTIDAIDTVLRHARRRPNEPFGGVQMLFIGDMFQLPPVVKDAEWQLLSDFYSGPYFFNSSIMAAFPPMYIEFDKIYRQSDEKFIHLLNQVRNNELDEAGLKTLESRYKPAVRNRNEEGYIVLTTHNESARNINRNELAKLDGPAFMYKAKIEGEFPENSYPADQSLQLKVGAQVMFIKNDSEKNKRYYNGKLGIVTGLEEDRIIVQCKDDPGEIELGKVEWENIRYTLNKATRQMDETVLGSFTQFPLRLAWAITIHKSQGLTFEKAIIDTGEAFARGQVYVALSRCTNLEGMVLQSKIRQDSLFIDHRIIAFSRSSSLAGQLQEELAKARKHYLQKLLLSIFDLKQAIREAEEMRSYLAENASSVNPEAVSWHDDLLKRIFSLQATADKFQAWINIQFGEPYDPEQNLALKERVARGASHFVAELKLTIEHLLHTPAVTDSRIHAKEYNDAAREVFAELTLKKHMMLGMSTRFDVQHWHDHRKNFVLPVFPVNAYAGASQQKTESPHPALHQQLKKLRDNICSQWDTPVYMVAGSKSLDEMARYLPQTLAGLKKISGFGDAKIAQYGQRFLDIIIGYAKEKGLTSSAQEKRPKRERKSNRDAKKPRVDTKDESYRLYRSGMAIPEIAKTRNRSISTIEDHLAHFVSLGMIDINELISHEKKVLIEPFIRDFAGGPVSRIKEKLGVVISFGEIRFMIAWQNFKDKAATLPQ